MSYTSEPKYYHQVVEEKKPFCCPVCNGRGYVPVGFYQSTGPTFVTSSTATDPCRSCNGKGVVWGPDIETLGYTITNTTE